MHHLGKMGQPKALCLCSCGKLRSLTEGTVAIQKRLILLTVFSVCGVQDQQVSIKGRLFKGRTGLGIAGKDQPQTLARLTHEHCAQYRRSILI